MSAFRRRWSELLKDGWSSKRPRGLETEHTHCRPGKSRTDVRGVDYFVGSEELMTYLDDMDKGEMARQEESRKDVSQTGEQQTNATTEVTSREISATEPSLVATEPTQPAIASTAATTQAIPAVASSTEAIELASRSMQGREATSNAADGEPEQQMRNLSDALDEVASDEEPRQRHCPTSPHIMDSDNSSDSTGRVEEEEEAYVDVESVESDTCLDVNVTKDDCSSEDYVTFDSDGENDDGFGDDEDLFDCDMNENYEDPDDNGAFLPDIPFDDTLLASVGGAEGITVENLSLRCNAAILEEMAKTGWRGARTQVPFPYMDGPYEDHTLYYMRDDYPNLFEGSYGPTPAAATTPTGALFYFMTPHLGKRSRRGVRSISRRNLTSVWQANTQNKWHVSVKNLASADKLHWKFEPNFSSRRQSPAETCVCLSGCLSLGQSARTRKKYNTTGRLLMRGLSLEAASDVSRRATDSLTSLAISTSAATPIRELPQTEHGNFGR